MPKITVDSIISRKYSKNKIACLTAYDYPTATMLDSAGMDIILVGDSLGNVVLGYEDTRPVTIEEMIHHAKAVRKGVSNALLIVDMPLQGISTIQDKTYDNCRSLISRSGADGIKIEGAENIEVMKRLTNEGCHVMGHIGYTPQTGGKPAVCGKTQEQAEDLVKSALMIEQSGAFSVVLEMIEKEASKMITDSIKIPTIGCGSGPHCNGQILVLNDIIGMTVGKTPSFAKKYAYIGEMIKESAARYAQEVRTGEFPLK